jgi:iron(III) transport system substrate-binding protein
MTHRLATLWLAAAATFAISCSVAIAAGEVNVYSSRPGERVQPLLDAFTRQTGIETNLLYLDQGLLERIQSEGDYSPADIILAVDDSRLTEARQGGITQPLDDATLNAEIPAQYRDPEGHWFGLTVRPRVFYGSRARIKATAVTYQELSQPQWKGKVCMRDGRHASNIALIASMIDRHGEAYTEKWLTGLKANLARKPRGSDRSQAEAVASGVCDIGIGNAEYLAAMVTDPAQKDAAQTIRVIFPNAADRGASVGISGMALARHAPNRANAVRLMVFLASRPAQELYSAETNEYPVAVDAAPAAILQSFGPLKAEDVSISQISALRKQALDLVDKVQFNDGPTQ